MELRTGRPARELEDKASSWLEDSRRIWRLGTRREPSASTFNLNKSGQTKSNEVKQNQTQSNRVKQSQTESNSVKQSQTLKQSQSKSNRVKQSLTWKQRQSNQTKSNKVNH